MFVFALFNLQGTVLKLAALAVSLLMLPHPKPFVKNFFSSFFKFFQISFCFVVFTGLSPERLDILPPPPPFVKHYFRLFSKNFGGPFGPPNTGIHIIKECHQLIRNRRLLAYKPQQKFRRCLHHGRQRNYGPADSSASQPLHGSWA